MFEIIKEIFNKFNTTFIRGDKTNTVTIHITEKIKNIDECIDRCTHLRNINKHIIINDFEIIKNETKNCFELNIVVKLLPEHQFIEPPQ